MRSTVTAPARRWPRWRRNGLAAAAALVLAGCAVGPDFKTPDAPNVTDASHPYSAAPLPAQTAGAPTPGGAPQRLEPGADVPAQWWQMFGSPPLDALVRAALAHSPSLVAAQAALAQAQETYAADAGAKLLPSVSGQAGATREHASQAASTVPGGSTFSLYNTSVNVSYAIDAFGATRRTLEGLQAQVDYQRFQVEAAYLSLTGNLVTAAIQEASLRAQLRATLDVVDAQQQSLSVLQQQARLGAIAQQAVLAQRTQIAQTRALLPALEKALGQARHQIAALAGHLPGDGGLPEFELDSLRLPLALPVSLPSALVRQRPDIQASEALLHAASAQVGVATANQYPQFTLSASLAVQSGQLDKLFSASSQAWSLGAGLLAPIFNGGALQAQRRAAEAAYRMAQAQYQQTVLGAFVEVANALRALDSDAKALQAQANAESLARQSLSLLQQQYDVGALAVLPLLDAQRAVQQTRIARVQAQAARYADSAALFQALGGGWWNRGELAAAQGAAAFAPLPPPSGAAR